MPHDKITLAFVGDVMLGRGIDALRAVRRPEAFWGDTLALLHAADAVVANLECPITAHDQPWRRTWKAYNFRADPGAVDLLKAANIRAVNLANNHILDFEEPGLLDTLAHLDAAGIAHAGAGRDSRDAARPALFEIAGHRIGLIGLTDNVSEFAADQHAAGTNYVPIRPDHATLSLIDLQVRGLRHAGAEVVILSAHWGLDMRTWPPASSSMVPATSWTITGSSRASASIGRWCFRSTSRPAGQRACAWRRSPWSAPGCAWRGGWNGAPLPGPGNACGLDPGRPGGRRRGARGTAARSRAAARGGVGLGPTAGGRSAARGVTPSSRALFPDDVYERSVN